MASKDEQVRLAVTARSQGAPITETVHITLSMPTGLAYVPGSLKANIGNLDDSAAPVLTWRGSLEGDVLNLQWDAVVRETQPRWLDVDVYIENPPGITRLITTSLIVNPYGLYLPVVLRR